MECYRIVSRWLIHFAKNVVFNNKICGLNGRESGSRRLDMVVVHLSFTVGSHVCEKCRLYSTMCDLPYGFHEGEGRVKSLCKSNSWRYILCLSMEWFVDFMPQTLLYFPCGIHRSYPPPHAFPSKLQHPWHEGCSCLGKSHIYLVSRSHSQLPHAHRRQRVTWFYRVSRNCKVPPIHVCACARARVCMCWAAASYSQVRNILNL